MLTMDSLIPVDTEFSRTGDSEKQESAYVQYISPILPGSGNGGAWLDQEITRLRDHWLYTYRE